MYVLRAKHLTLMNFFSPSAHRLLEQGKLGRMEAAQMMLEVGDLQPSTIRVGTARVGTGAHVCVFAAHRRH